MYSSALNTYDGILQSTKDSFNQQIGDTLNNFLGGNTGGVTTITFSSTVINNGAIPFKYTKDGGSVLPGVSWTAVGSAQSYAYVINHTNSSMSTNHLLLKNIPSTVTSLTDGTLGGGVAITNSFGVDGYTGPEKLATSQTYNFHVYALKVSSINSTNALAFYSDLESNKVGVGSFTGTYVNNTLLFI